jgi:hypothetical protein
VGKITGVVKNTAGSALSGISVRMQDANGNSLSALYPNQTTDAAGAFTFDNVRTAKNAYRVVAAQGDATYRPAMKQQISVQEKGSGGTIVTNIGSMTLVAQSVTTAQNIIGKIVDGDDGWMLGYAEVKLIDWQGNTVSTVRTVYTNNAYTDCDSTPPVSDPPTNIPKQQFSSGGICGDFTFGSVNPGTYSIQVTGTSWASGNQTYNDLLQEDVIVTGPQQSRFLLPRAGNATTSTIYDPTTHSVRAGPTISGGAAIGDGAHAFAITSGPFAGRYILVRGNNQNTTRVFNPIDNSSTIAGPNLSAAAGAGAHSFSITSGTHAGKTLIVHGRNTNTTSLYDPATHTIVAGPNLSANAGAGAHAFTLTTGDNAGRTVIVHGNGLMTTSLYDPSTHTITAGLSFASAINTGAFAFPISSGVRAGQILIVAGGGTNVTHAYMPGSPADSIAVGPNLQGTAGAGASAFAITSGPKSGQILFIHGNNSTTTSLYLPGDSFDSGPVTSSAIGAGSSNFSIDAGTHAGKRFVTRGANTTNSFLFDPSTSPDPTFLDGPTLSNAVNTGAFALKLEAISAGRLPLVRTLTGQDLKIVLSWGSGDPYDLDLHVVGTLPSGQTVTNVNGDNCDDLSSTKLFHVWAARPNVGMSWAQQYSAKTRTYIQGDSAYNGSNYFPLHPDTTTALVQDAITGFGPEAINFIGGYTDGTYWFSVANWSQWFAAYYAGADKFNQQWDVTNVEIKVYDSTGLAFQVVAGAPTVTPDFTEAASQAGCSSTTDWQQCELWRAFKMQVSGTGPSSRVFTPVNQYANWPDSSGTQDQSKCKMGGNW